MNEIKIPYVNQNDNCLYCATGNVFSWYGFEKESIDFIFSGQLHFYYGKFGDYKGLFPDNFVIEKAPLRTRLEEVLEPYSIEVLWHEGEGYEMTLDFMNEAVKERPVVLGLDHFRLPYHESYQKEHGVHFVTLLDVQNRNFNILDSIKAITYRGVLEEEIVKPSLEISLSFSEFKNMWIDFNLPDRIDIIKSKQNALAILKNNVFQMKEKDSSCEHFYGINAIKELYEDLMLFIKEKETFNTLLKDVGSILSISFEGSFISILRVVQQRSSFADYLKYVCDDLFHINNEYVQKCYDSYKNLSEQWKLVRNLLYLICRKRKLAYEDLITNEMKKIIIGEIEAVEHLEELVGILETADAAN